MPLKFISEDGGYVSDVIEAIEYGKKMDVKIFNCSWTMDEYNEALEFALNNTDAVFVCAAGNYSSDVAENPVYPVCFNIPNVISVAAIDNNGELACFSNYGSKVDVAAPGVGIMSTIPNNQYRFEDGTSMAVPFVTGVAALVKSKNNKIKTLEIIKNIEKGVTSKDGIVEIGVANAYKSLKGK